MENKALAQELLQEGGGVLRLAPAWVPIVMLKHFSENPDLVIED